MSLTSVFSVSLSGMNAASAQMNAVAHNVANADTDGYKAQRVDTVSLSNRAGVTWTTRTDPTPGPVTPDGAEASNVDPANEAVNGLRAQTLYTANAAVVKTTDKMLGSLLDILEGDPGRRSPSQRRPA